MQQADERAPWRANFVEALGLLARAAAGLPFGVPDPVLSGASAVELYSGGLWSSAVLEVLAEDAARLTAELFAVGSAGPIVRGTSDGVFGIPNCRLGLTSLIEPRSGQANSPTC